MINLIVAGDFCPTQRVNKFVDNNNVEFISKNIISIIKQADYSLINLECPIVHDIYKIKPIKKTGPFLKSNANALKIIKQIGFRMVTLANNHFFDYGDEGVEQTLIECSKIELDTVGGGRNIKEASMIVYKTIKGKKFAFVNFCENEFSIATETSGGSNPVNPISNFYQIVDAKKKSDFVIVIFHGGTEHYQLPTPYTKSLMRFYATVGASAVIMHHAHCYSGYEIYNKTPIFYGIGNFCFDSENKRNSIWNDGYLVNLSFKENNTINFTLYPYSQCNDFPNIELKDDNNFKLFNNYINEINDIIGNDELLSKKYEEFVLSKRRKFIKSVFEPYSNRYLLSLYYRNLLPSFISNRKALLILNLIRCESHRDAVIKIFKQDI